MGRRKSGELIAIEVEILLEAFGMSRQANTSSTVSAWRRSSATATAPTG